MSLKYEPASEPLHMYVLLMRTGKFETVYRQGLPLARFYDTKQVSHDLTPFHGENHVFLWTQFVNLCSQHLILLHVEWNLLHKSTNLVNIKHAFRPCKGAK